MYKLTLVLILSLPGAEEESVFNEIEGFESLTSCEHAGAQWQERMEELAPGIKTRLDCTQVFTNI